MRETADQHLPPLKKKKETYTCQCGNKAYLYTKEKSQAFNKTVLSVQSHCIKIAYFATKSLSFSGGLIILPDLVCSSGALEPSLGLGVASAVMVCSLG